MDAGVRPAASDKVAQPLLLLVVGEVDAGAIEEHQVVLLDVLRRQVVEVLGQGDVEVARRDLLETPGDPGYGAGGAVGEHDRPHHDHRDDDQ